MQAERWLYPEMGRWMMLLGVGAIGLSALMGLLIRRIRGGFKAFSRRTIFYTLVYAACFALIGLCIGLPLVHQYMYYFIFFQVLYTMAGIIHLFTMRYWLKWTGPGAFWPELLHLLIIMLLGAVCMIMTYRILNREGAEIAMSTAALFFLVPYFVYQTYERAVAIPPKIFRQWYYPLHSSEPELDETKLKNLLVISFEFQKHPTDRYFTNFRAKAPVDMEFGELFYYFINDYNERHNDAAIRYSSNEGDTHGWIFYRKPKWYHLSTRYIDTEKTVFINNIRENDVIICNRVS
ncbi:MAG TPA: TssN family type VI secretion system protein [Puia sp.]|nr:TssN family type VI secretion system protein [Puia sp.]